MGYLVAHVSKLLSFQVTHCAVCSRTHLIFTQNKLYKTFNFRIIQTTGFDFGPRPPIKLPPCDNDLLTERRLQAASGELSVPPGLSDLSNSSTSTDQR